MNLAVFIGGFCGMKENRTATISESRAAREARDTSGRSRKVQKDLFTRENWTWEHNRMELEKRKMQVVKEIH